MDRGATSKAAVLYIQSPSGNSSPRGFGSGAYFFVSHFALSSPICLPFVGFCPEI